jgi:hypothetical protein
VQVADLGSAEHAHAVRRHYTAPDEGFLKHAFDWIAFRIYRGGETTTLPIAARRRSASYGEGIRVIRYA